MTSPTQPPLPTNKWAGAEATVPLEVVPPRQGDPVQPATEDKWSGAEATQPFSAVRQADPDATPIVSIRWEGAEKTQPMHAAGSTPDTGMRAVPTAHIHLTEQFAPFSGHRARRGPRLRDPTPPTVGLPGSTSAPVDDLWHQQGRSGALTGQVFGDYEIGAILGEGGMGIIYRARQRSLSRRVAVKTLASNVAQDPVQRGRFELEARAAGLIRSPHVVQVYAAGSYNDISYFVMEFIDGTHLGAIVAEHAEDDRNIPPDTAAEWVLHAARGLAAAGLHGIVHRDIKPSNLLITVDRVVKIADFGISKIQGQGDLTRTGTAIGTPSYVSPEQGRGELCDQRTDIYSLGVVFYELLTGRKPFTGDTPNAVIYQHNYAEPRLPREIDPGIPDHYQAVVLKCLQKDPAKRYQNATELLEDLERIKAGNLSITAVFSAKYGTGADDAMRRYLGRGRRWMAPTVAALVLISAGAFGGLWWWQNDAGARAEQRRQLEHLRTELRGVLDVATPLPPSASADVDRLAAWAGAQDPDVVRWRLKLMKVSELTGRLGRLDEATLASAALAGEAQADLNALTVLVGDSYPGMDRWRTKLQSTAVELARLRDKLGVLDRVANVTIAQQEDLATEIGRFTSLAGDKDADLGRWRARIAATDVRLASLKSSLVAYDDVSALRDATQSKQLAAQLDEYLALRGPDHLDEDGARWQQRVAAERQRVDVLRTNLAQLDQVAVLSESTQARLATDLALYQPQVEAKDSDLLRWQRKLADAARVLTTLRANLAALDHIDDLNGEQLDAARRDLEVLRPLVTGDDAQVKIWTAALSLTEARLKTHRAALAVLDQPDEVAISKAQQVAAEAAIVELDRRQILREESKIAYRKRLIAESERLADLRKSLAIADLPDIDITPGLVDKVLLFGRLAGSDDVDYVRWYGRVVRAVQLRDVLAALDVVGPVPDRARDLLAEYAVIMGPDDRRVRQWRGKLDRVTDLRRILSPLDRVAPAPLEGNARLAELIALIGPFPGSEIWRGKLDRIHNLAGELTKELSPTMIRLAPTAREHLALLGALVGTDEVQMRDWSKRLAYLAGPGQPRWAKSYMVDASGPKATLVLSGDPEITSEFRYIPPGEFVMGSPLDEAGRDEDEAQVRVTLTKGYWLGVQELRQDVWQRVMDQNPSMSPDAEHPVQRVTWGETQDFIKRINELVPGLDARLPTEAEWEHAARAGDAGAWQGPRGSVPVSELHQISWFRGSEQSDFGVHSSGRRQPNGIQLQDTQGNVWEWCADRYGVYSPVPVVDPLGFESELRVARGGSWGDQAEHVRVANRVALPPQMRSGFLGLRLVAEASLPPEVRIGGSQDEESFEDPTPPPSAPAPAVGAPSSHTAVSSAPVPPAAAPAALTRIPEQALIQEVRTLPPGTPEMATSIPSTQKTVEAIAAPDTVSPVPVVPVSTSLPSPAPTPDIGAVPAE